MPNILAENAAESIITVINSFNNLNGFGFATNQKRIKTFLFHEIQSTELADYRFYCSTLAMLERSTMAYRDGIPLKLHVFTIIRNTFHCAFAKFLVKSIMPVKMNGTYRTRNIVRMKESLRSKVCEIAIR